MFFLMVLGIFILIRSDRSGNHPHPIRMIFTRFFEENMVFIAKMRGIKMVSELLYGFSIARYGHFLGFWSEKLVFGPPKRVFERSSGKLFPAVEIFSVF